MGRKLAWAVALLLGLTAKPALARLLVVLPLDVTRAGHKLDADAQNELQEMLRDLASESLGADWNVSIVNSGEATKCSDDACFLSAARELSSDFFVSGTVRWSEGEYTASIRLVESKLGHIVASERLDATTVRTMRREFEAHASSFFAKVTGAPAARADASASVAPVVVPIAPVTGSIPNLAADTPGPVALPASDQEQPHAKKSAITQAVGQLTVTAKPQAVVSLEIVDPTGKKFVVNAPYINAEAEPGHWRIAARASGYEEDIREFEVETDAAKAVAFDLQTYGGLSVIGEPAGAEVKVTGPNGFHDTGGLPAEWSGLKRGTYRVTVSRKGYSTEMDTAEVQSGNVAIVKVAMRKGAPITSPPTDKSRFDEKTGLEFVYMAGGTFHYGCEPGDSACNANERPGRVVSIDPFWMGKTDVTVEAYVACVNAGACAQPKSGNWCNWGVSGREAHPINCVTWIQAKAFCEWIGGRLPTAEEWEYAAKSGASHIYPWGNAPLTDDRANVCEQRCKLANPSATAIENEDDGFPDTSPVGAFPSGATKQGLLDMSGDVFQWTSGTDGADMKEARGGSWLTHDPKNLRTSYRYWRAPTDWDGIIGMRCSL